MKRVKQFATEAELCARFIANIGPEWTAYAETAGWDILLVRKDDGFQIGIEAKLRLSTDVINQALETYGSFYADFCGPDCRAVMVPSDEQRGFGLICQYIGLTIIYVRSQSDVDEKRRLEKIRYGHVYDDGKVFEPRLPGDAHGVNDEWFEWAPGKRESLPDYIPDVTAGSPSPVQLTDWKVRAIKIAIIMEKRGFLTRSDFKHISIDHRRWLPSGNRWLKLDGGVYRAAIGFPNFRLQHPRVYEEIAADYEVWKPADPVMPEAQPKQEPLL